MANWYKIPHNFRLTQREFRANIDGMNIVFGAVLGFVLAGANDMAQGDFAAMLCISAAIVVMILYLASSEYLLFNILAVSVSIAGLPYLAKGVFDLEEVSQLQPTLAVWAVMVLAVSLIPRGKVPKVRHEKTNEKTSQENAK